MAQLPPKIPATISPHWAPSFSPFTGDFLDSGAGKGSHRRSMSDSVAFLDAAPFMHSPAGNCFDRIDDDQLISMFSDELTGAAAAAPATGNSSSPSSPSDQDSNCEDKHMAIDHQPPELLEVADPKRVKRILANRQSAQRSRVRKLQYISELERSVTTLQTEVSALSPRVAYLDHQRLLLNVDNSSLKQRLAALAQDKIFKDAHQEALKKEIERLRQKYNQQNMKKMAKEYNYNMNDNTTQLQAAASNSSNIACNTKEHLIITS